MASSGMAPEIGAIFGEATTSHPPFRTADIAVSFYQFPVYAVHATGLAIVNCLSVRVKLLGF